MVLAISKRRQFTLKIIENALQNWALIIIAKQQRMLGSLADNNAQKFSCRIYIIKIN